MSSNQLVMWPYWRSASCKLCTELAGVAGRQFIIVQHVKACGKAFNDAEIAFRIR